MGAIQMAKTFNIGFYDALIVTDGMLHFADRSMIFDSEKADVDNPAPQQIQPIDIGQNVLALRTETGWALFETGASSVEAYPTAGRLKDNLALAGIPSSDVTALLPTHGHRDHIGGVVDKTGALNFPHAALYLTSAEHAFWLDDARLAGPSASSGQIARLNLSAASERVLTYRPEAEILPGIHAIPTPGHTMAHTSFLVSGKGDDLFVAGDLIHDVSQIENPQLGTLFDFDRHQATMSRIRMLDHLAATGTLALFYHLPWPGMGYVRRQGKGFLFEPIAG